MPSLISLLLAAAATILPTSSDPVVTRLTDIQVEKRPTIAQRANATEGLAEPIPAAITVVCSVDGSMTFCEQSIADLLCFHRYIAERAAKSDCPKRTAVQRAAARLFGDYGFTAGALGEAPATGPYRFVSFEVPLGRERPTPAADPAAALIEPGTFVPVPGEMPRFQDYYPPVAMRYGVSARTEMTCWIQGDGSLFCPQGKVVESTGPITDDIAAAFVSSTRIALAGMRVAAKDQAGPPIVGKRIIRRVGWTLPE